MEEITLLKLSNCSAPPDSPTDNWSPMEITPEFRWKWCILCGLLTFTILMIFSYWMIFAQPQYEVYTFESLTINGTEGYPDLVVKPVILMWTRVFREQNFELNPDCPFYNRCVLTYDHDALTHADAIIYHIPDIKWVHPLKPSNMAYDLPEIPDLPPKQTWHKAVNVFLSQENPSILEQYYKAKSLKQTTRNFFHWTMTYMHSSDLPMPYGGYWISPEKTHQLSFTPVRLPYDRETILKDKKVKGVVWFVSHCDSKSKREIAVEALARYIPVNIGGACANTTEGRQLCPQGTSCDHHFAEHYFYIAAENDICKDYVTEKFWHRYQLPSVPIVMRKHIYEGFVPDNSYIAMDQFKSPKAMGEHLNYLMNNPDEYMKYFDWRSKNWSIALWNHEKYRIGQCALCERLLKNPSPSPTPIPNAVEWFEHNAQCEGDSFARQWSKMH